MSTVDAQHIEIAIRGASPASARVLKQLVLRACLQAQLLTTTDDDAFVFAEDEPFYSNLRVLQAHARVVVRGEEAS